MRWLLILMIGILTASSVTGINMGFAPGVNAKNIFMYTMLAYMTLRFAIVRDFKPEPLGIHVCFAAYLVYTILTFVVCAFILEYPKYPVVGTSIILLRAVVDPILFFLVVFHGLRGARDAKTVLKAFFIIFTVANILTLTDVAGLTNVGTLIGYDGGEANRVFGFFGHANETAAMLIFLMPIMAGLLLVSSSTTGRLVWGTAIGVAATVFLLNGSRGGLAGLALGGLAAAWICRRYLNFGRLALAAIIVVPILLFAVLPLFGMGNVLLERLTEGSSTLDSVSSGRSTLWSVALGQQLETPITLFTGFGFQSWQTMGFEYDNPHSLFLGMFFELGLLGLGLFVAILVQMVATALASAERGESDTQPIMIGFVFGMLALSVSLVFSVLIGPWTYIYAVMGAAMRLAVSAPQDDAVAAPAAVPAAVPGAVKFGWKRTDMSPALGERRKLR